MVQLLNHGRVFGEHLIPVGCRTPGRRRTRDGDQVFRTVRDAVKRTAVDPSLEFVIQDSRRLERTIREQGDDCVQRPAIGVETVQQVLRQVDRRGLARPEHPAQVLQWHPAHQQRVNRQPTSPRERRIR
jgi:hypothetical protein